MDDGSTDNSRSVIESSGSAVRPIFQPNHGQGSADNTGFANSSGNYVLFLDSDDAPEHNAVDEAVKLFKPGVAKVQFICGCLATQQ